MEYSYRNRKEATKLELCEEKFKLNVVQEEVIRVLGETEDQILYPT